MTRPSNPLAVWLRGRQVAELTITRRSVPELRYLPDVVAEQGEGALGLSVPLPVRAKAYRGDLLEWWMDCLLPEGQARTGLEALFQIRRGDSYQLLTALGRDCAGAVAFTHPDSPPAASQIPKLLKDAGIADAIAALPRHPLGASDEVRVSLGGLQSKLLLVRMGNSWTTSSTTAPSTHILKPDPAAFPGLIASEAFAQRAARLGGLDAAHVALQKFADQDVLVVKRFDRESSDGIRTRLHQEDGCQALGLSPNSKYQTTTGTASYHSLAKVLTAHAEDPDAELRKLAAMMTFTVAIGNTDAHLRNHAFLHAGPALELAPLYDAAPTVEFARTKQLALWIADQPMLIGITRRHLGDESTRWGLPAAVADEVVSTTLDRLEVSIPAAADQFPQVDPAVVERCLDRVKRLKKG